jgi:hypothetical protein
MDMLIHILVVLLTGSVFIGGMFVAFCFFLKGMFKIAFAIFGDL